jgi:putative redox protein
MTVTLTRQNDDYLFHASGPNQHTVSMDFNKEGRPEGASPMELLLMAIGGCNAIDIIYVLKKQRQTVSSYTVKVTGERAAVEKANPFKSAMVEIYLEGDIIPAKALRAAALSFEQYCSVSMSLRGSISIDYAVFVNGEKVTHSE